MKSFLGKFELFVAVFSVLLLGESVLAQSPLDTLRSLSAADGLYSNQIPDLTPPESYTEVCWLGGELLAEIHAQGESPVGGACQVGSTGWIIERNERPAATWADARAECLRFGMRLPEPFEWKISCQNADDFALSEMTGGAHEWASNRAVPLFNGVNSGAGVTTLGEKSCADGSWGWVAIDSNGPETARPYRCVR